MPFYIINADTVYKPYSFVQAVNSRYIECACLKLIGAKIRYCFLIGYTSRSTAYEWLKHFCHLVSKHKTACSLWPVKPFMSRKAQCRYIAFLHIYFFRSCCLCRINNKFQAIFSAYTADFFNRHNCSADIGRMSGYNCLCVAFNKRSYHVLAHCAVFFGRYSFKSNSIIQ